jgi:hypothetical protein
MTIKCGDSVIDPLTGFTGVVTSRTEYLFGCVRVAVVSSELKDGKEVEGYYDEQRLNVLKDSKVARERREQWDKNRVQFLQREPGGPGDVPPARSMPPGREVGR